MEISFCVPTYNRADDLKRCLDSILINQDDDIEVVVQDNCSPDHTKSVIDSFSDQRLNYYRNPENIGLAKNIITIIEKATGRYIFFLTDDDYLMPDAIPKIKNFIQANDPSFFTSHAKTFLKKRNRFFDYFIFERSIDRNASASIDDTASIITSAHILTRVCFKRSQLDLAFLKKHGDNWYPQMLVAMQMVLKGPVLYLAEPLVVHTWENATFWGVDPNETEIFNQGIVNMIGAMRPHLDVEMLEAIIIKIFTRRNDIFSEELLNMLCMERQSELRERFKYHK